MNTQNTLAAPAPVAPADLAEQTQSRVTRRLAWILSLSMLVAMMDRNNVNLAALEMNAAIGLNATALGIGLSLFYVAYLIATVPSNVLLARYGARRWIARIMISWGLVCALSAFAWDAQSFYVARFVLGLAEAGFLPGVFLYLSGWVPQERRGRMNSYFLMAIPVASVVTAVVSGFILKLDGLFGLAGWQLIFVLEAVPALILGVIVLFYLDDRPCEAEWLTAEQKAWLETTLAAEEPAPQVNAAHSGGTLQTLGILLRRKAMWVVLAGYFAFNFSLAALVWIPQILQAFKLNSFQSSLLTALPAAAAIVIMAGFARSSDVSKERRWHFFAATVLCTVGFTLAAFPFQSLYVALGGLVLASGGAFAGIAVFWTLPPLILSERERPVGMGFVTTIGVIGGMLSPVIMGHLKDVTGSYSLPLLTGAVLPLLGGVIIARGLRHAND